MPAATVRVTRAPEGFADLMRSYAVVLDGHEVAKLRRGESWEFRIRPGIHRLQMRIDWSGSPELEFTVAADHVAAFTCAPATRTSSPGSNLFRRMPWIELERA